MATPKILLSSIPRHLTALSDSLPVIGEGKIKNEIVKANHELERAKSNPKSANLEIISEPFFLAFNTSFERYCSIVVNYLSTVFQNSSADLFPGRVVTERSVSVLTFMYRATFDTPKIKACQLATLILLSPSGHFYVHNNNLYKLYKSILSLFNVGLQDQFTVSDVAEMTLHETMRKVIGCYDDIMPLPGFHEVRQLSEYVMQTVVDYSLTAIEVVPQYPECASIHDVDIIVAIRALTNSLENKSYSAKTNALILATLNGILNSQFSFLSKPFFKIVLNDDIRVALLAGAINDSFETAAATASLIVTLWSRFSWYFIDGLNEVLDSGLSIQLSSPNAVTVKRACSVFSYLSTNPNLFIDAFVNYDCDHSGYYKNIFENSVNLIIKNSYPSENISLQTSALSTVTLMLEYLAAFLEAKPQNTVEEKTTEKLIAQKEAKNLFDQGLDVFKTSPKKGLKFFIENKIVEDDPVAIGNFFFDTPSLDPAAVGEIIGGSAEKNKLILKQYVSRFSFKGLGFEPAFRLFLKKFMIPGEGQMIDRIMEQFGTKYYEENPQYFSCADTVYVLAYSALMLHTDAHNKAIKKHMTLPEFITNNRGIDNGHDLNSDFLTDLYKGITSEQIFILATPTQASTLLTQEQRADLYKQQAAKILQEARSHEVGGDRIFKHSDSPMLLGPMLKSIWGGLVAALSMSIESTEDPTIYNVCLRGLAAAMHIASRCYVEDALKNIIDAFAKFTRMHYETDVQRPKNIAAANTMLKCVITERNYLKGAWQIFLEEVSSMEKLKEKKIVQDFLQQAEELFQATTSLDKEEINDFTKAQCEIALREIQEKVPRYYMLQRIGDVAFFNMDRPNYVWNDIWNIVSPCLIKAGLDENQTTSSFTVDLLRQLAQKFLSKPEMAAFHFQARFLQPFLEIFKGQKNEATKDLIIEVIDRIVRAQHHTLHSGWTVILAILEEAAKTKTIEAAFKILEVVLVNYPDDFAPYVANVLPTLSSLASNDPKNTIAFATLPFFTVVCEYIKDEETWLSVFAELTKVTKHKDSEIRIIASESVLEIALKYGCCLKAFTNDTWNKVLTVSIPNLLNANPEEFQLTLVDELFDQLFTYPDAISPYQVAMFAACIMHNKHLQQKTLARLEKYMEDKEKVSEIEQQIRSDKDLESIASKLLSILKIE